MSKFCECSDLSDSKCHSIEITLKVESTTRCQSCQLGDDQSATWWRPSHKPGTLFVYVYLNILFL